MSRGHSNTAPRGVRHFDGRQFHRGGSRRKPPLSSVHAAKAAAIAASKRAALHGAREATPDGEGTFGDVATLGPHNRGGVSTRRGSDGSIGGGSASAAGAAATPSLSSAGADGSHNVWEADGPYAHDKYRAPRDADGSGTWGSRSVSSAASASAARRARRGRRAAKRAQEAQSRRDAPAPSAAPVAPGSSSAVAAKADAYGSSDDGYDSARYSDARTVASAAASAAHSLLSGDANAAISSVRRLIAIYEVMAGTEALPYVTGWEDDEEDEDDDARSGAATLTALSHGRSRGAASSGVRSRGAVSGSSARSAASGQSAHHSISVGAAFFEPSPDELTDIDDLLVSDLPPSDEESSVEGDRAASPTATPAVPLPSPSAPMVRSSSAESAARAAPIWDVDDDEKADAGGDADGEDSDDGSETRYPVIDSGAARHRKHAGHLPRPSAVVLPSVDDCAVPPRSSGASPQGDAHSLPARAGDPHRTAPTKDEVRAAFQSFLDASDLRQLLDAHAHLIDIAQSADAGERDPSRFDLIQERVAPLLSFRQKSILRTLAERRKVVARALEAAGDRPASHGRQLRVVVVGAGPCGLRTALELAMMGHRVCVLEKRGSYTRHNVLHLWTWVTTDLLTAAAARATEPTFGNAAILHIGTRRLQLVLSKACLLLGVQILPSTEYCECAPVSSGWEVRATQQVDGLPSKTRTVALQADALVGAGGTGDPVADDFGFTRVTQRLTTAIGLVAHFEHGSVPGEADVQQRSLARQFNTALFEDLAASGLDLENIVYFRSPDVHYFVCTPRRASLIAYGALLAARPPATLLRRDNVDSEAVASYARRVATRFGLPEAVPMMPGWSGAALFDFSARSQATEALRVVEHPASAHAGGGAGTAPVDHPPLLVGLSGDSLMEPFWPEGLGINRGFLGALDTSWALHRSLSMPLDDVLAARAAALGAMQSVSGAHPYRLKEDDARKFTADPRSRYRGMPAEM